MDETTKDALYWALEAMVAATEAWDVQEVGGKPLELARKEAENALIRYEKEN